MSAVAIGLACTVAMLVLLFIGVPLGFGMALAGFAGIVILNSVTGAVSVSAIVPFEAISSYNYSVLPLFLLMANICGQSGMGSNLFLFVYKWMGRLPGGLAIASVVACTFFGAVSASTLATSLTIGSVAIPEMRKYQYNVSLATACCAASGVIGILIPPSSLFIIYGIMTEQSIGELFTAGIIPGLLLAILFCMAIMIMVLKNPKMGPAGPSTSISVKFKALINSGPIFILMALVIGGLLVGWFTPTEAGAIGAGGALLISITGKSLSWKQFNNSMMETITGTAMIYLMIIGGLIFNSFIALSTLPQELSNIIAGFSMPAYVIMGIIVLVYIILGCFIDSLPLILLTVPSFYPVVVNLGFDPIWFGVIIVLVSGIGSITPPVGMNIFVIGGITKDVPMGKIYKGIIPFILCELILIVILIAFPKIPLLLLGR